MRGEYAGLLGVATGLIAGAILWAANAPMPPPAVVTVEVPGPERIVYRDVAGPMPAPPVQTIVETVEVPVMIPESPLTALAPSVDRHAVEDILAAGHAERVSLPAEVWPTPEGQDDGPRTESWKRQARKLLEEVLEGADPEDVARINAALSSSPWALRDRSRWDDVSYRSSVQAAQAAWVSDRRQGARHFAALLYLEE